MQTAIIARSTGAGITQTMMMVVHVYRIHNIQCSVVQRARQSQTLVKFTGANETNFAWIAR
jgi:hypothetical protein